MARRLSRWWLTSGRLGPRETVVEYQDGVFPDGFEFDAEGGVWCASVVSNRVVRVAPDGTQAIVLEDCDPAAVEAAMEHWRAGGFSRADMNLGAARRASSEERRVWKECVRTDRCRGAPEFYTTK